jgi:Dolichyl-phosphate-mannose-protein mannosyltransferase
MTKKGIILIGFVLAKFLLQYLLYNPAYDLQRDEYLYLDQAHHLAWGYLSVPPVTSWIAVIIGFFGNTVFWIRFFPALFGALTLVVVWKVIEELKGTLFALVLGATCILLSCLFRLNALFQQNSLDVLCWVSFSFVVIRYINTQKPKWLFIGAVVFALAFLNKYNVLFFVAGLFPAILLSPQRKLFAKKEFIQAAVLALLLILPNIIWQCTNHFPVVTHMRELTQRQLVNIKRLDFFKEQLFYYIGSFLVILAAVYALLFYPPFKKYAFFAWAMIFTLAIFSYFRAKGYYAIGLYPIYISFGAVWMGDKLKEGWTRWLQPILLAIPVFFFFLFFYVFFSTQSPDYIVKHASDYQRLDFLRWEDGKDHSLPQDNADMLGWRELGLLVDSVYEKLPPNEHTLILCDNYGQAGAINYFAKNIHHTAVSFNADYINWFDLSVRYDNLIRVKEYHKDEDELTKTGAFFGAAAVGGEVANPLAREYGTTIFVFEKAKIDIRDRIKQEMIKIRGNR